MGKRSLLIPPSPTPDYDDFFVVPTSDVMMIGDIEIPDQHSSHLQKIIKIAKRWSLTKLIIAGDFVHADQFSPFPTTWARDDDPSFRTTLDLVRQILTALMTQFLEIYIISGNHDERIAKNNHGHIDLGMFLNFNNVHFSPYGYMYLYTTRGPVYIGHPHSGGKGFTAAQNTYNVVLSPDNEKCHIVLPHYHFQSSTWSSDGLRELHLLPASRDVKKTKYKRLSADAYRAWIIGGLALRNGYFYPLSENGTDWPKLLK